MSNLDGLHPYLRFKAERLIRMAKEIEIDIIITQGLRTIAYQNSLYAQGRTKPGNIVTNARGGYSYHNFGLAFDFGILNHDGKTINWNTSVDLNKDKQKDWYQVATLGQSIGLEAGAFWNSFVDVPHLQYTFGLTTAQLRAGKKPSNKKSDDILQFQQMLKKLGANITADGYYGDESINAVKQLQKKYGLTSDGIVGSITYSRFAEELKRLENPAPAKPVEDKEVKGVTQTKQDVSETHADAWKWAEEKGFLNGENPKNSVTREQFATVLKRVFEELNK